VDEWKTHNAYTDFWQLANFWKHYYPHQPSVIMFPKGFLDIQVNLGQGLSGPVVRDIIVPAYSDAVLPLEMMAPALYTSRAPLM
jgi:hypothetical protein